MNLDASNEEETSVHGGVQTRGSAVGEERGLPVARAAQQIDVHENVLRKWVKEFETDPRQAFPGQGKMKPEQAEIERLRREVARLKIERDILKKAAAFFAKESS
jgi:transposase